MKQLTRFVERTDDTVTSSTQLAKQDVTDMVQQKDGTWSVTVLPPTPKLARYEDVTQAQVAHRLGTKKRKKVGMLLMRGHFLAACIFIFAISAFFSLGGIGMILGSVAFLMSLFSLFNPESYFEDEEDGDNMIWPLLLGSNVISYFMGFGLDGSIVTLLEPTSMFFLVVTTSIMGVLTLLAQAFPKTIKDI